MSETGTIQSQTCVTYPIVAALLEAERHLKSEVGIWGLDTKNHDMQAWFYDSYLSVCRGEISDLDEIKTKVSKKADVLNKFLKDNGFSIQLDPFDPDGFGVVSILDVLVKWIKEGIVTDVECDGTKYPAVRLNEGVSVHKSPNHNYPVAKINTKGGKDFVCMTILDEQKADFELVDLAIEISKSLVQDSSYGSVVFPMINLNQEVDISWLLGMTILDEKGKNFFISQAKQQTKLRMNQHGARVESAVAIGMRKGCAVAKKELVIDKPFLIWIEREGLQKPLFVGHLQTNCWKNPGSLD